MAAYRYERGSFWLTVAIATGLTALVTFLAWVVLNVLRVPGADGWTVAAGLVFFGFCSLAMIRAYATGDTVLAVQPQGYLDTRWRAEAVPWEAIARVEMLRLETEWRVAIYLWNSENGRSGGAPDRAGEPDWVSEIATLDVDGATLAEDISRYAEVRVA